MASFSNDLDTFFDAMAVIKGQTVKCCVFPPEYADPLSDTSADSKALVSTILLKRIGDLSWNNPLLPPAIGDTLSISEPNGAATQTYKIFAVDLFDLNYFTLSCRSIS